MNADLLDCMQESYLEEIEDFFCLHPGLDSSIPQTIVSSLPANINHKVVECVNQVFKLPKKGNEKIQRTFKANCSLKQLVKRKINFPVDKVGDGLYIILDHEIGEGSFKTISLALSLETSQLIASSTAVLTKPSRPSKEYNTFENHYKLFRREIKIQSFFKKDESFVKLFHATLDSINTSKNRIEQRMMFEYCNLGDLESYLKKHPFDLKNKSSLEFFCRICHDILQALVKLEKENIFHRDIKPANIYLMRLPNGDIKAKIGDFGFACKNKKFLKKPDVIGTPLFMSPEIARYFLDGGNEKELGSLKVDIWSAGIVYFLMATGNHPLDIRDVRSISYFFEKLVCADQESMDFALLKMCPIENLIRMMLCVDPWKRPTAEKCLEEFYRVLPEFNYHTP